jgi:hypothetical protein
LGGLITFATGWTLVGAGLRPFGRVGGGITLALGLYVVVGWIWLVVLSMLLGPSTHPGNFGLGLVVLVLIWPSTLAQSLGWFGLSFN